MSAIAKVYHQIRSKPSTAPDGLTAGEANKFSAPQTRSGIIGDLIHQAKRGTLSNAAKTITQGLVEMPSAENPLDDRKLLLEHGVSLLQNLPSNSEMGLKVAEQFITMLWKDLPHPPGAYVGPKSVYRAADGSGNNPLLPELGKAGTPYARSVPAVRPKPAQLPDYGLIFDKLLRREEKEFKTHPSGISSLFFSFATIVIHVSGDIFALPSSLECFQTNAKEWWINETSSYVDLSTLYGNNQAEQDSVRTKSGLGTLWNDTIASSRLMMMPPAVVVLLIIFSRNHNTIAHRLLCINEAGFYVPETKLSTLTPDQLARQDEDIFQKARNINVAWFAKIVLGDYVATILNTVRANSPDWSLDLGAEIRAKDGSRVDRGGGNAVSVEFNVLYHWHASMSNKDAKWIEATFQKLFPGKNPAELTPQEFFQSAGKHSAELKKQPPKEWTLYGLQRGTDGKYPDHVLAEILNDAIDEPAHAFGALGSPACLKIVEILGMTNARERWGCCTMNEFRKYLNLKPFETFEEWNPEPEIAAAARDLYGHIDDLELYPGLLAEEPKPAMAGSGTCTGHTIGRGILDDAVSLIRSDRFLTHDLNVTTLTSWGMSSLKKTPGSPGGFLGGLIFSALPNAYKFNSSYVLLPFYTPKVGKEILTGLGVEAKYSFDRLPTTDTLQSLQTFDACKKAFGDRDTFGVLYNDAIKQITGNRGFLIGWDDHARHDPPNDRMMAAFHQQNFEAETAAFFTKHADYQIKLLEWVADRFALPIKKPETPRGLFSIPELRLILLGLFVFSSFNIIPQAGWFLRETSLQSAAALTGFIKARINTASGIKDTVLDFMTKGTAYEDSDDSERFYKTLQQTGVDPEQLAGDCVGVMIPVAGNITQQVALLVDLFLRDEYKKEKEHIAELSTNESPENDKLLLGYIREGMRLQGVVIGLPRVARVDTTVQDGDRTLHFKAGDKLVIGISKAHMDPVAFPNPTQLDPTRPASAYILLGHGLHFCFGARLTWCAILASVKTIFKLKNLRREPGRGGQFVRIEQDFAQGLESHLYLDSSSSETPAPVSLRVLYDADEVDTPVGEPAVKGIKLKNKTNGQASQPEVPASPQSTSNSSTTYTEKPAESDATASAKKINRRSSLFRFGSSAKRSPPASQVSRPTISEKTFVAPEQGSDGRVVSISH
ncbi:linoleate diol synthase [Meredithblackwellia eburnea MCA 4105]